MSLKIFFTCFIILFCMAALFLGFKSKKKWYVAVIHQKNPVHIKINEGKVFFEFD